MSEGAWELVPGLSRVGRVMVSIAYPLSLGIVFSSLVVKAHFILVSVFVNIDAFVKGPYSRLSREGGSPELLEFPGFPFSRE